jgi:CBS-domain-containing membrane protein
MGEESPMNATVRDVMNARVIALKRTADLKEIVAVLRRHGVSACPVVSDAGQVIGVVSEADLLFKEADPGTPCGSIRQRWKLSQESKVNAVTAGHLMTSPAITSTRTPRSPWPLGSCRIVGSSGCLSSPATAL